MVTLACTGEPHTHTLRWREFVGQLSAQSSELLTQCEIDERETY
jgi:hypothetical protein